MSTASFVCIGETMAQFVPEPVGSLREADLLRMRIGGAESNVAIYLSRLGFEVEWVSRLGVDPIGDRVLDVLRAEGVLVSHVQRDPARPTGLYFKDPGPTATKVWYFRRGSAASALDREVWRGLGSPGYVHLTGITAAISTSGADLVRYGLEARPLKKAVYSFDVNYRPAIMPDSGDLLLELAQRADIVFVGYDEAQDVWGVSSIDEVRALLPSPSTVVVKDAERGATAFVGDESWFVPSNVVDVIELVGAGDAFAAGYLASFASGRSPQESLQVGHDLAAAALLTSGDVGEMPLKIVELFGARVSSR